MASIIYHPNPDLCVCPTQMDGLVRVNGETMEVSTTPASPQHSPQEIKDITSKESEKDVTLKQTEQGVTSKQTEKDITPKQAEKDVLPEETLKNKETTEQPPPPQTEKPTPSSGSAIGSLIGGRNCIITTTIVTELTQTHVEPLQPDIESNGQVLLKVTCETVS